MSEKENGGKKGAQINESNKPGMQKRKAIREKNEKRTNEKKSEMRRSERRMI